MVMSLLAFKHEHLLSDSGLDWKPSLTHGRRMEVFVLLEDFLLLFSHFGSFKSKSKNECTKSSCHFFLQSFIQTLFF